jgi:hypothetical protein
MKLEILPLALRVRLEDQLAVGVPMLQDFF